MPGDFLPLPIDWHIVFSWKSWQLMLFVIYCPLILNHPLSYFSSLIAIPIWWKAHKFHIMYWDYLQYRSIKQFYNSLIIDIIFIWKKRISSKEFLLIWKKSMIWFWVSSDALDLPAVKRMSWLVVVNETPSPSPHHP